MASETELVPIPQPPGLPLLGNVKNINPEFPLGSLCDLADRYGPIYQLTLPGRSAVFLSSRALVNEACDEKRFGKNIGAVLNEVRNGVHDGLFTARAEEPNWGIAHRVLMPAFGPTKIQSMFDEMHDIAAQLAMKWARHGSSAPINAADDFTRLTLDTLALCAMDYRFNSYYHDELHPFIEAMGNFLIESGNRGRRPALFSMFYRSADEKYRQDIELLRDTAHEVLKNRKENPTDRKDLMTAMLEGVDPKTGQKMSDNSIVDNLITFLIAGHETTSGLLSFAFYQLLKKPETYRKAQQEVDEVVGDGPIKVEHMGKLKYIAAILRETLRLTATIPVFGVEALQDDVLGGKYAIKKGQDIVLLLARSHLDPEVYGDNANEFVPERMLDENFERLNKEFPNCWKPFGNGMRACIGRPFAWQEALLVMAMLLQNFNFMPDDPNYSLQIKQTLTIKPKNFFMRASLRHDITPTELEHRLAGDKVSSAKKGATSQVVPAASKSTQPKGKPMSIYYGSNTGTCESLAQRLASDAAAHGFYPSVVEPLDAARQKLPTDQPVVIFTASYEGQPPDNAGLFVNWVENLTGKELEKVSYAVYGCGHHDWATTFHRIPKLVDAKLEEHGATRIASMGLTNAAEGNMFTDFETWEDDTFWPAMAEKYGVAAQAESDAVPSGLSIELSTPRSSTLRQDVKEAIVLDVKTLTAGDAPPKRHIEIQLPSDARYTAGDYLAVLPLNPKETIHRVMRRFQLAWDTHMTITAQGRTTLPTNISIPVNDVLGAYVELAQPATKRSILSLVEATQDASTRDQLAAFATDTDVYTAQISAKRVSLLDLLERFPSVELPFATFLSLLPPMRVRQYSISSSPLWNPSRVTLTYSLLDSPALSGQGRRHLGVASSYLASLEPGDKLHVSVRPSHTSFHLPVDAERTPAILIAAGSGLAPFRGFVQERAAQIGAGRTLAPALLFFGCRNPDEDDLYRAEMDRWERLGAVEVRRAYSRVPDGADAKGCKYVQDRLWLDRDEVNELWAKQAKVYVCGSRKVGDAVKKTVIAMAKEAAAKDDKEVGDEQALKWFDGVKNERFATDVFD